MMVGESGSASRYARIFAGLSVVMVLVGCGGLGVLPHKADVKNTNFRSYDAVEAAYRTITPGETRVADLGQMGFDPAQSPNVEVLSYLGIIEHFIPRDSIRFDQLDPKVQDCIQARDRCTALVFRPERVHEERTGSVFLDLFGFERETINYGWSAEVTLLMQDDRVVYKIMEGKPRINDYHDDVQPLGPFQDLSNAVLGAASRI